MKKIISAFLFIGLCAAAIFILTACGQITEKGLVPEGKNQLQITTSFYPLAEFARQIASGNASVINIVPAGAEPHDYEPTPKDIALIRSSDLFIYNGGGFEPWIEKIKDTLGQNSQSVIEMSKNFQLLRQENAGTYSTQDPHIWLSLKLAQKEVEIIRDAIISKDPAHAEEYRLNAEIYAKKLAKLDLEFAENLKNCDRNEFVTAHAAFTYLARDYNLTQIAIAGLSPDEEPSPKRLGEIAKLAKQKNITYIFFETLVNPKFAETVATEIGAQTLVLNPLEGLTNAEIAEGKNYLTVMEENLKNLETGLGC